ncbi:TPA: GNAT family N-acetyltransferase [Legionella pneumophila]|uniref:GNAT family N-acetyltransferase n=1 Tax=Legionella pneumophila TaxID=446 RepID=UPI0005C95936|nr:GNAT family N-acetyltransferase [Legionella pneumophila]HCC3243606.1 GNAT family N-acetyltransferase [Legionella pneumophila subsp. pneumophila]MCZ4680963.1 GNAT family N-acetyltransferase [Legionella pneumophila]HDV5789924.1 GNAT family N-acetyltransferase [Legionella pneumophila]HDV5798907.1 GNAT family N-acetyltransferase [Legionella pneumophila]HDV5948472.1 GNAT family N-acetyltransferase [Legionella pneumophila]
MLLFSSALAKHRLTFTQLSDCMEYIPLAAKWAEDEWGYIRSKGVEYREGVMRTLSRDVYIGTYAGQPVAMFALLEHEFPNSRELMYVYVDKEYRGLGFGKQVIEEAKRLTTMAGSDLILLDTLKPSLNRLYEKHGAKVICEGKLFSYPTDVLTIKM